jgi:hypothetical protein
MYARSRHTSQLNPNNEIGVVAQDIATASDGKPILRIDGPFGTASEEVRCVCVCMYDVCGRRCLILRRSCSSAAASA